MQVHSIRGQLILAENLNLNDYPVVKISYMILRLQSTVDLSKYRA